MEKDDNLNLNNLTKKLINHSCSIGPISILECRSGWRVYMCTDSYEDEGINLAYSTFNDDDFTLMIKKAILNLDKSVDCHGKSFTQD
ncbi:MAG: hypothetical protein ACW99G_06100 [Candidatus Thorarchaeota archaeon]|jgi:hypothetical protein